MGDVQEVRIVGQRINEADALNMLDVMLDAFETVLKDPVRLLRFVKLAGLVRRLEEKVNELPDPS